jgi:acyl-[acyl carrier protein]--UDP-N-acetylglucosamine O-acyltransferase
MWDLARSKKTKSPAERLSFWTTNQYKLERRFFEERKINALRIVAYDVLYVDQLSYAQRNERHA